MAIPCRMFGIQLCHATATRAFLEGVLTANIHDHLDVIGIVNVQLFTHGPEKLILTGRNDAVLKDHLNDVSVILDGGKVSGGRCSSARCGGIDETARRGECGRNQEVRGQKYSRFPALS